MLRRARDPSRLASRFAMTVKSGAAFTAAGIARTGRSVAAFVSCVDFILALEVGFVLVIVGGVAMMHVPTALILGGLLGVLACERASTGPRPRLGVRRSRVPEPRMEPVP